MKYIQMAAFAAATASLVLGALTTSRASETYILRSTPNYRMLRPQSFEAFRPSSPSSSSAWMMNSRIAISDPDDPNSADGSGYAYGRDVTTPESVEIARRLRGTPYVWGGVSRSGFDCSGFVRYVYAHVGRHLPRTAREQYRCGSVVNWRNLRPGDILFFHTSRAGVSHVGIYVGNNNFIHAANPRRGVVISELSGYYSRRMVGARRM